MIAMSIVLLLLIQLLVHSVFQLLSPGPPCFDDDQCADLEQVMRER